MSNRKKKAIRRLIRNRKPEEIAQKLNLSLEDVLHYLEKETSTYGNVKARAHTGRSAATETRFAFGSLLVILFALPFLINPQGFDYADLTKRAFLQCGILIVLLIWVVESLRSRSPAFRIKRGLPWLPALIFLAGCFLSLLWAGDVSRGLVQIIHWVTAALYLMAGYHLLSDRRRFSLLLGALALAGAAGALIGALQFLLTYDGIRQVIPPAITFANKNFAAEFIILCLPAALGLLLLNRRRWLLLSASVAWALMTSYVFYSFTKSVWVAYLGQLVFLILFLFRVMAVEKKGKLLNRDQWIAIGLSIVIILIMINLKPAGGKQSAAQSVEEAVAKPMSRSADTRFWLWFNTFELIKRFPFFGMGVHNFEVYYPMAQITSPKRDENLQLDVNPRVAHNDFLQLQAELGLAFTVSLMAFAFLVVRRLPILWRRALPPADRLVLVIALMGFIGYGIDAFFSSPTYKATPPVLSALYGAFFFRFSHRLQQGQSSSEAAGADPGEAVHLPRPWAWVAASFLMVLSVFWIHTQIKWVKADIIRNALMYHATKSRQWEAVVRLWPIMTKLDPMRLEQYTFVGLAYLNQKRYDEAIRVCLEHHERYPHDPMNLYNLVLSYMRIGQYEKALPFSEHLLAIFPVDEKVITQHEDLKARLTDHTRMPRGPEDSRINEVPGPDTGS